MRPVDLMRQAIVNALRARGETVAAELVEALSDKELQAHWPGIGFRTTSEGNKP